MAASASSAPNTLSDEKKAVLRAVIGALAGEDDDDDDDSIYSRLIAGTMNLVDTSLLDAFLKQFDKRVRDRTAHVANFAEETIHRYTDVQFREHLRMSRTTFESLCEWVAPHLPKERTVPAEKKMLATLWLIGNRESYWGVADCFGMNKGTLHNVVMTVCNAVTELRSEAMKFPSGVELQSYADAFQAKCGMPGVVGVIDGTHIPIPGPSSYRESYINGKGFSSMQLQVTCNANLLFTDVYTGWAGSVEDCHVFRNSPLATYLEQGNLPPQYHILGDSGFPLSASLLVPFRDNGHLSEAEKKFNEVHSLTRIDVKRAVGLLKGKFRRLKFLDMTSVTSIPVVIFTACVLHNFIILHSGVDEEDIDTDSCLVDGGVVTETSRRGRAATKRMDIARMLV